MSGTPRIPDIALVNLSYLLALKEAASRDPVGACYKFNLKQADISLIRDLSVDAIETLALGINESLVTLRYTGQDLVDLIRTPPALRSVFTAVRDLVEPGEPSTSQVKPRPHPNN